MELGMGGGSRWYLQGVQWKRDPLHCFFPTMQQDKLQICTWTLLLFNLYGHSMKELLGTHFTDGEIETKEIKLHPKATNQKQSFHKW